MPISAATVTMLMLATVATRSPASTTGIASGSSTENQPAERRVAHGGRRLDRLRLHRGQAVGDGADEQREAVERQRDHDVERVEDAGADQAGQQEQQRQRRDRVDDAARRSASGAAPSRKRTTSQPSGSDSTNAIATGSSASQMCWSKESSTVSPLISRYSLHLGEEVHVSRPHARLGDPAQLAPPDVLGQRAVPHQPVGAALAVDADGGAGRGEDRQVGHDAQVVGRRPRALGRERAVGRSVQPRRPAVAVELEASARRPTVVDRLDLEVGRRSKDRPRKPRSRPTKSATKSSAGAASSSSGAAAGRAGRRRRRPRPGRRA